MRQKLILFLAMVLLGGSATANDWPNWRGPGFNGISEETDWDSDRIENILWKVEVGTGFAGVAVAGGRVYTLGHDGRKSGGEETVYCLDVKSGKKIWSDSYPARLLPKLHEGGPAATPTRNPRIAQGTSAEDGTLNAGVVCVEI